MANKNNEYVRNASKEFKTPLWKLAEELQISETTLCRRMRKELPFETQEKYAELIINRYWEDRAAAVEPDEEQ